MIKLIREGSKNHPWILKIVVLMLAVTFVIGMGWFGYETTQQPNVVAVIGSYEVEAREFRRAYGNAYEFYQNQSEQEVVEADLKQNVINMLVDRKLWLVAADDFELDVHPDALRQAIMERREFQQNGSFDPNLYHRLLTQNRTTPKQFEGQLTKDLRTQKMQRIVRDAVTLNPAEMEEVEAIAARQTAEVQDETAIEKSITRTRLQVLNQKQQRALQAFQTAARHSAAVEIRDEFL